jgi:undecaprenyl-diphosphatase
MNLDLLFVSILEGLTEFLPVSSTAHLILLAKTLTVDLSSAYIKFYLLAIQVGALLAGVFFFAKKILTDKRLLLNISISFLPSAILGFILYKTFKHLLEGNLLLLSSMLFLGGCIFIYLEKVYIKQNSISEIGKSELNILDAFIVGVAQAVAIIPGVSRSGATITAGVLRGIKKEVIFEYTFLLALPTLGSAVLYDAYKSRDLFSQINSLNEILLGTLVSFIVAFITLYFAKKYITKISLTVFGIYRIILSILVFLFLF